MAVEKLSSTDNERPHTGDEIRQAFLRFFADKGHKIISSASLIPDDPTVLLTIAGMLPFKPVFLGQQERPAARATSSQKCIRTNDIDNVGHTARHHTFFEMLGNFSFGDYFKKEAIQWAWELSTTVFGLDPKNIVVSVFREDDEAADIWRDSVGVDPSRIIRMDEADNFWSSGPTGPCGPCSELYYDFKPELGHATIDLEDDARFIEFYNLVFMQYNRSADGNLLPLLACNIDTGMGLERMAQILQGVPNNYETDLIFPLVEKASSLAGIDYRTSDNKSQISLKVIGDHIRAVVQLISDGVMASNLGRGYILRRLLRRIVRHGRLLGINKPFLREMGELSIVLMQSAYPQLLDRRPIILKELQREELRFLETLERGEKLLEELLATHPKEITGQQAFELYDTYGFPLELTQEIAYENSLIVDVSGFENEMENQRIRAKAATSTIDLTLQDTIDLAVGELGETSFQGYERLDNKGIVKAIIANGQLVDQAEHGDAVQVLLDQTSFYAEGGGQIGDKGILFTTISTDDNCLVEIDDVSRNKNVFVHHGLVKKGVLRVGELIHTKVDFSSRRRAQAHHTATHLLQAALKAVVDKDICQAGSLVNFERLRFDFQASQAISTTQLLQIEKLINGWITEAHPLSIRNMDINDAKHAGAVAMFGEKYGDVVRVVDVPGISMELCGGTHVSNTSDIGVFKIVGEIGIAAGVRRIEAIAGQGVLDYLNDRDLVVKTLSERFKAQPNQLVDRVIALQDEVKSLSKSLELTKNELAINKTFALIKDSMSLGNNQILVNRLDGIPGDALQIAAQGLVDKLGSNAAVFLGGIPDVNEQNKVILVAAFGSGLISQGLNAGKFIGPIARICGGGGGGRPNLAQAGGKDSKALPQALKHAKDQLIQELS